MTPLSLGFENQSPVQCCNEFEKCLTWNKNKNNWRIWKNIKGKDLKDKNIRTCQFNGYLYLLQLSYTVLFVGEGRRFSTKRTWNVCLSFKLRQTLANTMGQNKFWGSNLIFFFYTYNFWIKTNSPNGWVTTVL